LEEFDDVFAGNIAEFRIKAESISPMIPGTLRRVEKRLS